MQNSLKTDIVSTYTIDTNTDTLPLNTSISPIQYRYDHISIWNTSLPSCYNQTLQDVDSDMHQTMYFIFTYLFVSDQPGEAEEPYQCDCPLGTYGEHCEGM